MELDGRVRHPLDQPVLVRRTLSDGDRVLAPSLAEEDLADHARA
jgi:hypothetical protein